MQTFRCKSVLHEGDRIVTVDKRIGGSLKCKSCVNAEGRKKRGELNRQRQSQPNSLQSQFSTEEYERMNHDVADEPRCGG